MDINELNVFYQNKIVGYLKQLSDGRIGFQYDRSWIEKGFSISPFSLPLTEKIFFPKSFHFDGLFGVFYDCLPDGWGRRLITKSLMQHGIDYEKLSPLVKLSLTSDNSLGALEFIPNNAKNIYPEFETLDELAKIAESILKNENMSDTNLDTIYKYGGSSGGSRPKAHIMFEDEEWIVKFACYFDGKDAGVNEYRTNILAGKAGVKTAKFRLFPSEICSGYFGSKRFDRIKGNRIHMVSLSSILETSHRIPNLDYMHFFQVTDKISKNKESLYECYRIMCFNVLLGNKDDHGKNFSFIYDELINSYTIAPSYDLTETPEKNEHEMTVLGNGKPDENDLRKIIKSVGLDRERCESIIEEVKNALT